MHSHMNIRLHVRCIRTHVCVHDRVVCHILANRPFAQMHETERQCDTQTEQKKNVMLCYIYI